MQIEDIISLLLLLTFVIGYVSKLILLRKRDKIDGNTLAKGKKDILIYSVEILVKGSSLLWLLTWLGEIIFHSQISEFLSAFFTNIYTSYTGIIITTLGVGIFILATIFMKSSWRVGIDKNTKTTLVTDGIYKFSRNPAFVGFNLMFAGLFISYANILTLLVLITNIITFHLLILQEEKHLFSVFGDDYTKYKKKAPRYFLIF